MTTKKFTDLTAITGLTLAADDIFALTDINASESKKIQASELTNFVLSDANLTTKTPNIISKLNAFGAGSGNGLQAQKLYANGAYQTGAYFLSYANITGKPTIPTDTATFGTVAGFENSGNFVSYDTSTAKIRVTGTGSTALTINSDYINEGTSNLFYTDARVDARQTLGFGSLFNTFSSTFDGGEVRESLQDVAGIFQNIQSEQSNLVRISDKSVESDFSVGQLLRIYGASASNNPITTVPTISGGLSLQGFGAGTATGYQQFEYKVAHFNLKTGEIGVASAASSANVQPPAGETALVTTLFNTNNFISLNIQGSSADQGALVYRRLGGAGNFKLVAVLGPKELQTPWKDYYTFDFTSWSGKSATDNSYSSITHFPLTPPTVAQKGWADFTITSINSQSSHFDISFGTTFAFVNSGGAVQIAHNDTNRINDAIITKSAQGRKSITLNAKTYNASHVSIPDNFGLVGVANITKIKKLPWSGYNVNTADNSVIKSSNSASAMSISLVGVDVDGNITNQYLHNDDTDKSINYLLDFGTNPSEVIIDRCRIRNVVGGGVYASTPNELKISTSEVTNSSVTDRFLFSPLFADNGTTTIITSNRFENFTDSIDLSVTSEGVVTNNIVKACGSGIFVYGSTFFLSSPNILMGAANEFLSTPDILNSEYDSINIPISAFGSTAPYNSDTYSYQENGAAFDISQTSISSISGEIVYRANLVRKLADGAEEEYGNLVGPGATGINNNGFSTVTNDGFIEGRRYRIITPGNTNWTNIGAPNANAGTTFTAKFSGTVGNVSFTTPTGTTGVANADEFVGYPNQSSGTSGTATPPIHIQDVATGMDRTQGQFKFEINDSTPLATPYTNYTNLKTGIYSRSALQTLYATELAAGRHPAGSSHVGIGYTVSYRYYVKAGDIKSIGSFDNGGAGDPNHPSLTIKIEESPLRIPLSVGSIVKVDGKTGFSLGDNIYGGFAQITSIGVPDGNGFKDMTLKFWGNTNNGIQVGTGENGTINIIDDFIMAKGLIK